MKFQGTIQNGELILPITVKMLKKQFLASFKDGTLISEELKKFHGSKTQQQLGAIFGLALRQIVTEFDDFGWDSSMIMKLPKPTGIGINKDMLLQFFYSMFPIFDDNGKQITLSKMDTAQAADFFDKTRNFAASQWSIVISSPNKNWKKTND